MEAAVELRGVVKRFDDVVAVDNVDLTIRDGEFFSLLGSSGCGKTTTLRMMAGLEFPTEGSIRVYGEEMGIRPPNKRPINTVFQSYALFPHMTVAENVSFGLRMLKVGEAEMRERTGRAIDLVRLSGMEHRKPDQLSGGQQQRVALARALVNRPKVLLLDEPLGALDLKLRHAMQLELKELQERVGITFIYVTHDQEEALTMSDRIGVMDHGSLLQIGTPEEIYEHPRTRFIADFIGETNFLDGVIEAAGVVKLPTGTLVRAETHSAPGTPVTLTLRPEKVYLYPTDHPPADTHNAVPGTVRRRVYMGSVIRYLVDLGFDTITVAHENAPGLHVFAEGDPVLTLFDQSSASALSS
jgi:spermidine/putrescine transport system ATP-binding protein